MSTTLELPFAIGETFYLPIGTPRQVTVPCPACLGARRVIVIVGDGEHVAVDCEACGIGFQRPQGTIDEWEHDPTVKPFVIASVVAMRGERWEVLSQDGSTSDFDHLFKTEAEALAEATKQADALRERNSDRRGHQRNGLKRAAWTVRYHHAQIKDLERQLAWHRSKLTVLAERGRPAAPQEAK